MAWTTVKDWAPAETVSAAMMDTYVSDNTQYLYENRFGNGRRNVLINSHMDVYQRGTTVAISNSSTVCNYIADRWAMNRNAAGSTGSIQTGPTGQLKTLRIQRDSGDSSTAAITVTQALESIDSYKLAGQTCQLKLNLKAGTNFSAASSLVTVKVTTGTGTDQAPAASWTGTADALSQTQAITTTATDYTFDSIAIPSAATQVKVSVSFTPVGTASTNDWFELSAAQLTAGKSPGWERMPYAQTLALCQRYYVQWGPYGTSTTYGLMIAGSATNAYMNMALPTEMRIIPAVTFSAVNDFKVFNVNTSNMSYTPIGPKNSITVSATTAAVLTTTQLYYLNNDQDTTNAAIYVNAEL